MARVERDREDLLAEATALVERVELELPGWPEHVIVGFRASGCGSVYLGPDEAYQFNTAGELRRGHKKGALYKSGHGRLVPLARHRAGEGVEVVQDEIDGRQKADLFRELMEGRRGCAAALVP